MCDKEIDQLLLSPRLYHRALDVSMFLFPYVGAVNHTDCERR